MLKKRAVGIALFFFLVPFVFGQETGVDIFDRLVITPPGPPEELAKAVLSFELRDYGNKELINDIHVYIGIIEEGVETDMLQYVSENGILELVLEPGRYRITLKVDDLETRGKDYFFESGFEVLGDIKQTVFLFPAGSLRGVVYEGGNVVEGANLKFDCSADYGEVTGFESDSFGSFSNEWMPIGLCRVSAEYKGKVGFKDVEIKKGGVAEVDVVLDKSMKSGSYKGLFVGVLLIFIVVGLAYLYKQKERESTTVELSSRTKDVLSTLKVKEKVVVDFLLENGFKSTQAKIRNNTGIPKTSLVRLFDSLEAKKVISVEKIGKLKKIKLTDWFLKKE